MHINFLKPMKRMPFFHWVFVNLSSSGISELFELKFKVSFILEESAGFFLEIISSSRVLQKCKIKLKFWKFLKFLFQCFMFGKFLFNFNYSQKTRFTGKPFIFWSFAIEINSSIYLYENKIYRCFVSKFKIEYQFISTWIICSIFVFYILYTKKSPPPINNLDIWFSSPIAEQFVVCSSS